MARGIDENIQAVPTAERAAPSREDTAHYVADMVAELSRMAAKADLAMLALFLEMALMEAREAARTPPRRRPPAR